MHHFSNIFEIFGKKNSPLFSLEKEIKKIPKILRDIREGIEYYDSDELIRSKNVFAAPLEQTKVLLHSISYSEIYSVWVQEKVYNLCNNTQKFSLAPFAQMQHINAGIQNTAPYSLNDLYNILEEIYKELISLVYIHGENALMRSPNFIENLISLDIVLQEIIEAIQQKYGNKKNR